MKTSKIESALKTLKESLNGIVGTDQLAAVESILRADNNKMAFLLIQEGGSSAELYLHSHETQSDAEDDRIDCTVSGAYRTSAICTAPVWLCNIPGYYELTEQLLRLSTNVEYAAVLENG